MFNLVTGKNRETKKEFLKLIQNQNQKENIIILKLECDTKLNSLNTGEVSVSNSKHIHNYIDAINTFYDKELPETESYKIIEQEIGHTSKFNQIQEGNKDYECTNKNNKSFVSDLNEKEIYCLINRIKMNNIVNREIYIKRQLLKKVFFNNLHVLINLDIIYDTEIVQINEFLKENRFKYSIIKPIISLNEDQNDEIKLYDIQLYDHETKFHLKLDDLNTADYIKLNLLMIKRDRDIIMFNAEFYFYSHILLIHELDDLCEYDRVKIDEVITVLRNTLVNYMNIQVIATLNCPELLQINNTNKEFVLEIYQENDAVDKVSLRKYEC
jgi:hypothetical protein